MTREQTKTDVLLDELLKDYQSPQDILDKQGVLTTLTKQLMEGALEAELTSHLGYEPHAPEGRGSGNSHNGTTGKTVQTDHGSLPLEIPRDRQGSFEPVLVKKRQRRQQNGRGAHCRKQSALGQNSRMVLNWAMLIAFFDRLGVPRLS